MSLYPFFDDFEDEFFNHPLIPTFPMMHPVHFYQNHKNNHRQNSNITALEKRFVDFSPSINLSEDENNYYIHADLPGMNKDQVKMEITDDRTFTISGERKSLIDSDKNNEKENENEKEKDNNNENKEGQEENKKVNKEKKFHKIECSYGKFERSFSIPEDADLDNIQAKMENGVLEVTFKKMEPPKSQKRTIQIQ